MKPAPTENVITPMLQRARGIGRISTKQRDGRTALDTLFQEGCGKIRLPNTHSHALEAVLINTAGGITGGDRLHFLPRGSGHLVDRPLEQRLGHQ